MTHHTNPEHDREFDRNRARAEEPIMHDVGGDLAARGEVEMPQIDSAADLEAAWVAADATHDPNLVRRRIITIAFNNNWEDRLPREARDWMGEQGIGWGEDTVNSINRIWPMPDSDGTLRPGGGL
jgi:hypothetical protein